METQDPILGSSLLEACTVFKSLGSISKTENLVLVSERNSTTPWFPISVQYITVFYLASLRN